MGVDRQIAERPCPLWTFRPCLIARNWYIGVVDERRKPIEFLGSSLTDLKSFPDDARSEAGHQLSRVQLGLDPADWKAMPTVGSGPYEIRVRDEAGAFRVI